MVIGQRLGTRDGQAILLSVQTYREVDGEFRSDCPGRTQVLVLEGNSDADIESLSREAEPFIGTPIHQVAAVGDFTIRLRHVQNVQPHEEWTEERRANALRWAEIEQELGKEDAVAAELDALDDEAVRAFFDMSNTSVSKRWLLGLRRSTKWKSKRHAGLFSSADIVRSARKAAVPLDILDVDVQRRYLTMVALATANPNRNRELGQYLDHVVPGWKLAGEEHAFLSWLGGVNRDVYGWSMFAEKGYEYLGESLDGPIIRDFDREFWAAAVLEIDVSTMRERIAKYTRPARD